MNYLYHTCLFFSLAYIASARSRVPPKEASSFQRQSSEVLVLTGGNSEDGMESSVQLFPSGSGCSVPALNAPRRDHITFSQGDSLISCGGTSRSSQSKTSTECVSVDLAAGAGAWVQHSSLTSVYREYASFAIINDMNCIVGGRIDAKTSVECLDSATNFWVELPEEIPGDGVYNSCSVNLPDGSVLFIGGSYDNTQILQRSPTGEWDASSWGQLASGVKGHSCSLLAEGTKVLVAGGENIWGYTLANTHIIDIATKEQTTVGNMNVDRIQFTMAYLDGAVVAVAGSNNDGKLDSAERYNEATEEWELLDFKTTPAVGNSGSVIISTDILGCNL